MASNVGSPGELLHGQILFGSRQTPIAFTQQSLPTDTANAVIGSPLAEVIVADKVNSEVKDYSGLDLSSFFQAIDTIGDIELPNVLSDLTLTYQKGGGDTTYTENAVASASGNTGAGVSVSGTAQASAFCIPKLLPTLITPPTSNVPLKSCFFATKDFTTANFLSILTTQLGATVLAWPVFKPVPLTFNLFGTKVTASSRADFQGSISTSSGGGSTTESNGLGFGNDYTPSIEQQTISPTIHGSFSLTASDGISHTGVTLIAVSGSISGGGGGSATAAATGSILPTSVPATSPAAIPTSGLYLYRVIFDPSPTYGWYFVNAIVFDFASIA